MFVLMAALGGIIAAPELVNGPSIIRTDDFPVELLRSNQSAFENIRIIVAPSGKAETCDVIGEVRVPPRGENDETVGRRSCALMIVRGKFRPAVGADGRASYGTYSTWISWKLRKDLSYSKPDQVDGDISVASLPEGTPDPALVRVDIAVAADGTPGICSPAPRAEYAPPAQVMSPALAAVACAQFAGSGRITPVRSGSGAMVASVQRLVARFSTTKVDVSTAQSGK